MKKKEIVIKNIATLGFLGYLPAPGTFGSLLGFLFAYLLFYFIKNIYITFITSIIIAFFAFYIIKNSLVFFKKHDPSEIIIDEFAASFFVFWGLNLNINNIILAFIIFRFFDITKILGISYLEKYFDGAFGILIDDIFAAFLTCVCINIFNYLNC